ncbi:MAG: hypothetical protein H6922_03090 [Pseudomonadaceae bacterium]|nr:hypothetical protein [Pseudomonadaceae bacterium]
MTFARVLALAVLVASPLAAFAEEAQYGAEEAVMMDSEASVQADAGVAMPDGEGEKLEDYMMKAPADVAGDGKAAGEIAADAAATKTPLPPEMDMAAPEGDDMMGGEDVSK